MRMITVLMFMIDILVLFGAYREISEPWFLRIRLLVRLGDAFITGTFPRSSHSKFTELYGRVVSALQILSPPLFLITIHVLIIIIRVIISAASRGGGGHAERNGPRCYN